MTSRPISWINRADFGALLERATAEPNASAAPSSVSPPPRAISVAAIPAAAPVPKIPSLSAPSALSRAGVHPSVPPPSLAPHEPFEPSSAVLDARLHELVQWIERVTRCRAAFIADDNGLPVVEHHAAEQAQIAAASSILLMLASVRSMLQDGGAWMSLKTSSSVLHVVEVDTRWGRFAVGVVCDTALPSDFLSVLNDAVAIAFRADPLTGSDR